MKILLTILSTATVLIATVVGCGFALDAIVVLSCCLAAGIAGIFVTDYSRTPNYNLDAAKAPIVAPARRSYARCHGEAYPVFASLIVFNTTIA